MSIKHISIGILSVTSLNLLLLGGQAGLAQSVQVSGAEQGQGFLFSDEGFCFLLTAAHVTDGMRRLQVLAQSGREGVATMARPFWAGFDLDVGQVRRLEPGDCTATLDDLDAGARRALSGAKVTLPLVGPGGVDNLALSVTSSDYLVFDAAFEDPALFGRQGMSGGFALLGEVPVGMAFTTAKGGSIQFIQMAEIVMNLRRWMERSALAPSAPEPAEVAGAGLRYEVISAIPPAIDGTHVIEAMQDGSGFFAYPAGQDATILLRNLAEGKKRIARIRIESRATDGFTQPERVLISFAAREGAKPEFWRSFLFPPDGAFDTGAFQPKAGSELVITLIGARGNDPVRVDRIQLD
ncbi:hypothetical protein [Frigidibacter sp. MR17.24]|uniref:hypothetical protein n=1 Tax=Frigidibacter sp. MR17.24 TaxID=3127345 RepID=UPI003012BBB5